MEIRLANPTDAKSLLEIYKQYIDTPITFEYELPTAEEFQKRITEIYKTYPYLVCLDNNIPIGYAYAHRFQERAAYQWNVEISVYIDKNHTSKGLGKTLCNILLDILTLQGVKNVYSYITGENTQSKNLHLKLGFKSVGTTFNTGFKCGKWQHVEIFEKQLSNYDIPPQKIIPITQISQEEIRNKITKNFMR